MTTDDSTSKKLLDGPIIRPHMVDSGSQTEYSPSPAATCTSTQTSAPPKSVFTPSKAGTSAGAVCVSEHAVRDIFGYRRTPREPKTTQRIRVNEPAVAKAEGISRPSSSLLPAIPGSILNQGTVRLAASSAHLCTSEDHCRLLTAAGLVPAKMSSAPLGNSTARQTCPPGRSEPGTERPLSPRAVPVSSSSSQSNLLQLMASLPSPTSSTNPRLVIDGARPPNAQSTIRDRSGGYYKNTVITLNPSTRHSTDLPLLSATGSAPLAKAATCSDNPLVGSGTFTLAPTTPGNVPANDFEPFRQIVESSTASSHDDKTSKQKGT